MGGGLVVGNVGTVVRAKSESAVDTLVSRIVLLSLADPAEAAAYRDAALEDSPECLLTAFDHVARVRRVIIAAKDAGVGVVRTHVKST